MVVVALMSRLVIPGLRCLFLSSLSTGCHFLNNDKYEVIANIALALLILVCGVFFKYATAYSSHL